MSDRHLGILFVLSAPSGAGKTSIRQRLFERMPGLVYSVSFTTRPPRAAEREGIDYHFIDRDEFRRMEKLDQFLESAEVHGNLYGTALAEIEKSVAAGQDVVLDIDVQGADLIKQRYGSGPIVRIFILPPSTADLDRRLRGRGSEDQTQLERRLRNAPAEILRYKDYDYAVVNRELERATEQVACIVEAERCRSRNFTSLEELLGDF